MMKPLLSILFLILFSAGVKAQQPVIEAWQVNTEGTIAKYYQTNGQLKSTGELAQINQLCYSDDSVWIKTTGMPAIFGPWTNPGTPVDQNFTFRFPRNPVAATSEVEVPKVFVVGVLVAGAVIFGNGDARSYKSSTNTNVNNGDRLWNGNAYYTEGQTLDSTYAGHVNQDGTYHSHATPFKLYKDFPTDVHSPIVGFAFDGYPVYGPFGYTDANDKNSGIKRIKSSYRLRSISNRTTLPDGSPSNPAGPSVNATFPLGMYIEDYEFVNGLGDLDDHNGRWCVTPEYPDGTYAYFVTTEDNGDPAFPYYFGDTYYGKPDQKNMTVNSTITIPASVTSCTALGVEKREEASFQLSPNPVKEQLHIRLKDNQVLRNTTITIANYLGEEVLNLNEANTELDLSLLPPGIYTLTLYNSSTGVSEVRKFVKQ